MADLYASSQDTLTTPARRAAAVVPSDTVALDPVAKALYIGAAGDVVVLPQFSTVAVTFKNVQPGTILPVVTLKVLATGTTATSLVALA